MEETDSQIGRLKALLARANARGESDPAQFPGELADILQQIQEAVTSLDRRIALLEARLGSQSGV